MNSIIEFIQGFNNPVGLTFIGIVAWDISSIIKDKIKLPKKENI